eukprot:GEMP01003514.1.p1 GENE.GEMP01003514.1~~GEMP01003514.1.p1  ORF type:complete len:1131 (+),score=229.12 GEMP01003514.1:213-3605(+)
MFPIPRFSAPPHYSFSSANGTHSMALYNTTVKGMSYAPAFGSRTADMANIAEQNTPFAPRSSISSMTRVPYTTAQLASPQETWQQAQRTEQSRREGSQQSQGVFADGRPHAGTPTAAMRGSHLRRSKLSRSLSLPVIGRYSHSPRRTLLSMFPFRVPYTVPAPMSPCSLVISNPAMQPILESPADTGAEIGAAEVDRPLAVHAVGELAGEGGHEAGLGIHLQDEETAAQKEAAQALSDADGVTLETGSALASPSDHNEGGLRSGSSPRASGPPSPLAPDSNREVRTLPSDHELRNSRPSSVSGSRVRSSNKHSVFLPYGIPATARDALQGGLPAASHAVLADGLPARRSPRPREAPPTAHLLRHDYPRTAAALNIKPSQWEETGAYDGYPRSEGSPSSPYLTPSSRHRNNATLFGHWHGEPQADAISAGGLPRTEEVPVAPSLVLAPPSPHKYAGHLGRRHSAPQTHSPLYHGDSVNSALHGETHYAHRYDGLRDPSYSRRPGRPSQPAPTLLHPLCAHGPHDDSRHSQPTKHARSVASGNSHEDGTAVQNGANAESSQSVSPRHSDIPSNDCRSQAVDTPAIRALPSSHRVLNSAASLAWARRPCPTEGSPNVHTIPFSRATDMALPAVRSQGPLSQVAQNDGAHSSGLSASSRLPLSRLAEGSSSTLADASCSLDTALPTILQDSKYDAVATQPSVSPPLLPGPSSPTNQDATRESPTVRSNSSTFVAPTAEQGSTYDAAATQLRVSSPRPPGPSSPRTWRGSGYDMPATQPSVSLTVAFAPSSPPSWQGPIHDPYAVQSGASFPRGSRPSFPPTRRQGSAYEAPSAQPSISLTVTPGPSASSAWQGSIYDQSAPHPGVSRRGPSFLAIHGPPHDPPSTPPGSAFSFVPAHVPLTPWAASIYDPFATQPTTALPLSPDLPPPSPAPLPPGTSGYTLATKATTSSPRITTQKGVDRDTPIASAPASSSRAAESVPPTTRSIPTQDAATPKIDILCSHPLDAVALDDNNASDSEASSDSTETASSMSSIPPAHSQRRFTTRAQPPGLNEKGGGPWVGDAEDNAFMGRARAESALASSSSVASVDPRRFSSRIGALLEEERMRTELVRQEHKMAQQQQRLTELRRRASPLA